MLPRPAAVKAASSAVLEALGTTEDKALKPQILASKIITRIDHSHAPATAACRAESLAGCVSPVDARYASPETGQIS